MSERYAVEIKNISANADKMKIARDETKTVHVTADSPAEAIGIAVRRQFDGCGFHCQERYDDGTEIGSVEFRDHRGRGITNQYGRIRVSCVEA